MFVTTILLIVITVLIVKWIRDRRYKHGVFERMGLQGPEPSLLMGNLRDIDKKGFKDALDEWTKRYGKLFGYYEGEDPVLVVSDPEHVKQIAIKEFHKFHSHRHLPTTDRQEEKKSVFDAQGDKWKRLRSITSPLFTTRRMKEMSPLINKSVDDLLDLFDKKCSEGKPFNIHAEFGRLTTDVISSCGFGIDAECIRDENSRFYLESKQAFDQFEALPLRLKIMIPFGLIFPGVAGQLRKIQFFDDLMSLQPEWIFDMAIKVINDRRNNKDVGDNRVDLLRLLLEPKKYGAHEETDDLLMQGTEQRKNYKPLSDMEMAAQIAVVMLAGYETTSTALGFTAYQLALNPKVQEKLQAEIDEHFPDKDIRPDYTTVHKLPYLEAVMKEVLRIQPIAPIATTRKCFEETRLGNITIPKGMFIQLNMDHLHFNSELWGQHDPKKFVPERFLEDCQDAHNNMAWIPFGAGPRICLGMRFAQMEFKIALARILKRFNIKRCTEMQVPCPIKKNGLNGPSEGVFVALERRE